jgi:NTE family protein
VLVLAPQPIAIGSLRGPQQQLDALAVPGLVLSPDEEALAAIGENTLDPAARAPAARAGHEQGRRVAAAVRAVWR